MRTLTRSEVEFRSFGPGLPAYLEVIIREFDPDALDPRRLMGQLKEQEEKAEEVAQWLFDHITVTCSEAVVRKLTTLLEGS